MKRSHLWAVLFLTLFLGVKSLEYHPLGHADDEASDRCELCDYALLVHATPFTAPEIAVVEGLLMPSPDSVAENTFTYPLITRELVAGQFYRPPPTVPSL